MSIGEKICELRKKQRLTQKELAMKLNISDKIIFRWENEKSIPDVEMLLKISEVFNVTISELYDCIEGDMNDEVQCNRTLLWRLKKWTLITSCFLIFVLILLLFIKTFGTKENLDKTIQDVLCFILFTSSIFFFVLSLIIEIVEYLRLIFFTKTMANQNEYKKLLKQCAAIYLSILFLSLIFSLLIIVL